MLIIFCTALAKHLCDEGSCEKVESSIIDVLKKYKVSSAVGEHLQYKPLI